MISDPGSRLVKFVVEQGHKVIPLPGACAAICALSASGLKTDGFMFIGFLPNKTVARKKALINLESQEHTLIFYEAARRLEKCIADIVEVFGGERQVVIARELTKIHEEVIRCSGSEMLLKLQNDEITLKGECVLLVEGCSDVACSDVELEKTLKILLAHTSLKSAVKIAIELTGSAKSEVYKLALDIQDK